MNKLVPYSTALLGGLIGLGCQLVWSLLVFLHLAHGFLNWFYSLYFIINPFQIASFNFQDFILAALISFILAFTAGWILAEMINRLHGFSSEKTEQK